MKRADVMRAALAGLLGVVSGAPGRNVPVYREYTQPISFYDEQGERTDFNAAAPDLQALRSMRGSQAQEGLMGKVTLLDVVFDGGSSVFGSRAPSAGMAAPVAGQEGRRQQDESGRNWLAKSLTLPTLGQSPTNVAATAMSAGTRESRWGWLADEVAGQPGQETMRSEDLLREEDYNPSAAPEVASADGAVPFGTERAAARAAKDQEKEDAAPSSASFPKDLDKQKPSDRSVERSAASARDLQGGDRVASATMQSFRTDAGAAAMSQTRQMLADVAVVTRPDFAALRESFSAALPGSQQVPKNGVGGTTPTGPSSMDFRSGGNPKAPGKRLSVRASLPEALSTGIPSWRGGWSSQDSGDAISKLPVTYSGSIPAPIVAAPAQGPIQPAVSSGGYKPAWY